MAVDRPMAGGRLRNSPTAMAAFTIAILHAALSASFALGYGLTEPSGPNGGVHLDMFTNYAFVSFALLLSGIICSAAAPGWRTKGLLVAINLLPLAWVFVGTPSHSDSDVWGPLLRYVVKQFR